MSNRKRTDAAANRAYFEELGVLWLLDGVRDTFGGAKVHLEDAETGEVVKGRIKPK